MGVPGLMAFSPKFFNAAARTDEDAVKFRGRVGAVVPQVRVRMRRAERTRIFVGDEDLSRMVGIGENLVRVRPAARRQSKCGANSR